MAKTVLIVSNAASPDCQLLRNICARVRSLAQNTVSGYYGDDLIRFARSPELDSMEIAFILLGLSPMSQQKDSKGFDVEQRLLKRALHDQIPLGIVCDSFGRITAPHLLGGLLELVKVLGAKDVEAARMPSEIYPNAKLSIRPDLEFHVEIADQIAACLTTFRVPKPLSTPVRQMAAGQPAGWNNSQLTD